MQYAVLSLGALEQGLIYALLAVGVFVSLRVMDIPDLTVDGSFVSGAAVSVMITGISPDGSGSSTLAFLSLAAAILVGAAAGIITGVLHTKLQVKPLLAGIITMTALFSINLVVMQEKPTVSINGKASVFTPFFEFFSRGGNLSALTKKLATLPVLFSVVLAACVLLFLFFRTQLGLAVRATGDNEDMVRASSIDSDIMKIIGLAIANAIVALSGAVLAQHQNFADAKSGTGMVVVGIASIIIGETLFGRRTLLNNMISAVLGAIVYRIFIAVILLMGLPASYFKLLSAVIIVLSILFPVVGRELKKRRDRKAIDYAYD
ncbi:MAG: ABC transporter permease [Clostridiales bacterium]|jgi:putative ABC transport system permease protein|nr:ABC transporter permease [Clostridiales bacterium]